MGCLVALLACSVYGFGFVEESFFPKSRRPQFMIDYWRPEGTHIKNTSEDLKKIEAHLRQSEEVESVTTFTGRGALRFLLTYEPEMPNSAYGQLLVTVRDFRKIDSLLPEIGKYLTFNFPDAEIKLKKFTIGPGSGAKIEARFRGPDETVLRRLSGQAQAIMANDPVATNIRDDWRQKTKVLQPGFAEAKARRVGISRPLVTDALEVSFSGKTVGIYREDNKQIPIILRLPEKERNTVDSMNDVQVLSPATGRSVPLRQIISGIETKWEDPIIRRKNRVRTITAQCDPKSGNASVLFERLRPQIEAVELPAGYEIDWGGEYEDSTDAQKSLFSLLPLFFTAMVLTVIMLFNAIRQPLIIFLCLPLAVIGVTAGLLVTKQPFGFMSLLGFLSLSGMLIKNAVVLIDQIDLEIGLGKKPFNAILDSSVSRMRPVLMAAVTTVLGMIPLVSDPFYAGMSITIMAGLTFGTVLTLVVVPVFYAIFFRVRADVPVCSEKEPVFSGHEPWDDVPGSAVAAQLV